MSTAMVKTSLRTGLSGRAKWQSRPLEAGMVRSSVMISVSKPLCITETLSRGAGQYTGSGLPGEGRIILVGAHDVGYFEVLENAKKGQEINVRTSYGDFVYRITDLRVEDVSYISARDLQKADGEKLVLYTCYPFGEVFDKSDRRYFVTAKKVSGPVLVEDQQ